MVHTANKTVFLVDPPEDDDDIVDDTTAPSLLALDEQADALVDDEVLQQI